MEKIQETVGGTTLLWVSFIERATRVQGGFNPSRQEMGAVSERAGHLLFRSCILASPFRLVCWLHYYIDNTIDYLDPSVPGPEQIVYTCIKYTTPAHVNKCEHIWYLVQVPPDSLYNDLHGKLLKTCQFQPFPKLRSLIKY